MLKRALNPGESNRMNPDEEYSRITYERLWQTPNTVNLNIELFDQGGIRVQRVFKKVSLKDETTILQDVLGDGWETIFGQDYSDWAIRCQKRPRSDLSHIQYLPQISTSNLSNYGMWRTVLFGALVVGLAMLFLGWVSGRISSTSTASNLSTDSEELELDSLRSDSVSTLDSDLEPIDIDSSENNHLDETHRDETLDDLATISEIRLNDDMSSSDNGVSSVELGSNPALVTPNNDEIPNDRRLSTPDGSVTTTTTKLDESRRSTATNHVESDTGYLHNEDPFVLAVRLAQQAVQDGKFAASTTEWEAIAAQWQEASDLMAEVPAEDDRYAIAQDRVEKYENNRDVALSEAEKVDND